MEHRGKLRHDKRHSLRASFSIDCTEFVRSVQKANNFEMLDKSVRYDIFEHLFVRNLTTHRQ